MSRHGSVPRHDEIQIAIFCASPPEYDAVSLLFDESWDDKIEQYGRIGIHNVVLADIPNLSADAAADSISNLLSRYPSLKLAFLVGADSNISTVGGRELKLGDVIISKIGIRHGKIRLEDNAQGRQQQNTYGIIRVIETEIGRRRLKESVTGHLNNLQTKASGAGYQDDYLRPMSAREEKLRSSDEHKKPFRNPFTHGSKASSGRAAKEPHGCPQPKTLQMNDNNHPGIFFAPVTSWDATLRSDEHKTQISTQPSASVEDSGAGNEILCLFVRGIRGYVDVQDKDSVAWMPYATAAAAAVTKALLEQCSLPASLSHPENGQSLQATTPEHLSSTSHGHGHEHDKLALPLRPEAPSKSSLAAVSTAAGFDSGKNAPEMANYFGAKNTGIQAGAIYGGITGFTFGQG